MKIKPSYFSALRNVFYNRRNGFRIFIGVFTGAGRSGGFAFSGGTDGAGAKKFLNNFKKKGFFLFFRIGKCRIF